MSHSASRFSIVLAAFAMMACLGAPAWADDIESVPASPVMLPGANVNVCGELEAAQNFGIAMKVAVKANTVEQPTSFSSCLGGLLKQAQSLNNMFSATGLSVNFSFGELLQKLANQAIQQAITQVENQACQDITGIVHAAASGLVTQTSVTNLMGSTGGAALAAPASTSSSSSGGAVPNTVDTDTAGAAYDDLDQVANSGGVTLTAHEESVHPQNGGVAVADTIDSDGDTNAPQVPPTTTLSSPSPPSNATVCMDVNTRSDLYYDKDGSDFDGVDLLINLSTGMGANTGSDAELENAAVAQSIVQPGSQGPPQTGPGPGDPPSDASQNPASTDGPVNCSPAGTTTSSTKGPKSQGTPCTANTKPGCMAGSGCSAQNGSIGYAKNYQDNNAWSHPFGPQPTTSGGVTHVGNYGQCAQLVQSLVHNVGNSSTWYKGPQVYGNATLQFGTPIATFFGPYSASGTMARNQYKYEPNGSSGSIHMQHTGLYMGQTKTCMFILEEYQKSGLGPFVACMPWGSAWDGNAKTLTKAIEMMAMNYYVIVHH